MGAGVCIVFYNVHCFSKAQAQCPLPSLSTIYLKSVETRFIFCVSLLENLENCLFFFWNFSLQRALFFPLWMGGSKRAQVDVALLSFTPQAEWCLITAKEDWGPLGNVLKLLPLGFSKGEPFKFCCQSTNHNAGHHMATGSLLILSCDFCCCFCFMCVAILLLFFFFHLI